MAQLPPVTITFHGVQVSLPAGVSFSSDGATLGLDFSAGFTGRLQLHAGARYCYPCVQLVAFVQ